MSKAGIYKSDVKKARDAVLAQGKHPSEGSRARHVIFGVKEFSLMKSKT